MKVVVCTTKWPVALVFLSTKRLHFSFALVITYLTLYGTYRQTLSTSHYLHHPIEGNCCPKPGNQILDHHLITSYEQVINSYFYFLIYKEPPRMSIPMSHLQDRKYLESKSHHCTDETYKFLT